MGRPTTYALVSPSGYPPTVPSQLSFLSIEAPPGQEGRALLLARAQAAQTDGEISTARRAIRAWLECHPRDIDLLLADEAMNDRLALLG
jgi:hypothetical protein